MRAIAGCVRARSQSRLQRKMRELRARQRLHRTSSHHERSQRTDTSGDATTTSSPPRRRCAFMAPRTSLRCPLSASPQHRTAESLIPFYRARFTHTPLSLTRLVNPLSSLSPLPTFRRSLPLSRRIPSPIVLRRPAPLSLPSGPLRARQAPLGPSYPPAVRAVTVLSPSISLCRSRFLLFLLLSFPTPSSGSPSPFPSSTLTTRVRCGGGGGKVGSVTVRTSREPLDE